MNQNPIRILLLIFAMTLSEGFAHSQATEDTTAIWRIETSDGNLFFGHILSRSDSAVRMNTEMLGVLIIPIRFIKSIQPVDPDEIKKGEIWMKNPQAARYFYAPNGYGLDKGEGYYQNTWVLFNQVSYGITRNISLGAGLIPLFLFAGTATPIWITPKFSIPAVKDKLNFGGGVLLAGLLGENSQLFGIVYGVTTLGNRNNNITAGAGFTFYEGSMSKKPVINISGMVRTGKKGYILTENYYFSGGGNNYFVLSLGGRTIWPKLSLDYGLVMPLSSDIELIAAPWLGFTIPLTKNKSLPLSLR
jgi:hypothetical protein